ncbi:VacB/RNase II family 3'-5' exoribonuclease [Reinekea marinisedimentorum]|nr:VacB/RNase II family 3'-5' exoribonuclease [Reinekea marinisedimentorum]
MLDAKSLAVLQTLKTEIKASKEIFNGIVKGTGKSFGFVVSDQGEEHFLPPDQMSKVFPGDRVTYTVTEQNDGKTRAELESLVSSDFKEFTGVYVVRGKAQGVEPFSDKFSGWLFVPPKQTGGAASNSLVTARVTRHPWASGKAQAEVVTVLGDVKNNRSWYSVALNEYGIPETFTEQELQAAEQTAAENPYDYSSYNDLTELPFLTIDATTTRDIDDALYAEATENGWHLWIAIADAASFISSGSILDKAALQRLNTTYLPGLVLPMVPQKLSNEAMSLVENEVRPAVVFKMALTKDGSITRFEPSLAKVKNHAKLNYAEVSEWLDTGAELPENARALSTVFDATRALAQWRRANSNPPLDRADFRIRVDEQFNVSEIEKELRNSARDLVEEAMVATNYQVALWLKDSAAPFMTHAGFKADRETELKGLLREFAPAVSELDGANLEQFIQIMKVANETTGFPLASVLQKRFDRGQWQTQAAPHFGLGLPCYTNATSPIRKYSDLVIHRIIKAKLQNEEFNADNDLVEQLNERGSASRFVSQNIENRLRYQWLAKNKAAEFDGTIAHINASGLSIELNDNGARGFIDLRKKKDQFSYDPLRMLLKFEDHQFQLGMQLKVKISQIGDDFMNLVIVEPSES